MYKLYSIASVFILIFLSSCMTASQHHSNLPSTQERETTVGLVQKYIHTGMSQPDVAAALGSPNIVTKDSDGDETWIYDKIAREASVSQDAGGTGLILNLFGFYSRTAGASSTTERTLTVIIKFDEDSNVKTFSYHASKF